MTIRQNTFFTHDFITFIYFLTLAFHSETRDFKRFLSDWNMTFFITEVIKNIIKL